MKNSWGPTWIWQFFLCWKQSFLLLCCVPLPRFSKIFEFFWNCPLAILRLSFRNRIHPFWDPWTEMMQWISACSLVCANYKQRQCFKGDKSHHHEKTIAETWKFDSPGNTPHLCPVTGHWTFSSRITTHREKMIFLEERQRWERHFFIGTVCGTSRCRIMEAHSLFQRRAKASTSFVQDAPLRLLALPDTTCTRTLESCVTTSLIVRPPVDWSRNKLPCLVLGCETQATLCLESEWLGVRVLQLRMKSFERIE